MSRLVTSLNVFQLTHDVWTGDEHGFENDAIDWTASEIVGAFVTAAAVETGPLAPVLGFLAAAAASKTNEFLEYELSRVVPDTQDDDYPLTKDNSYPVGNYGGVDLYLENDYKNIDDCVPLGR